MGLLGRSGLSPTCVRNRILFIEPRCARSTNKMRFLTQVSGGVRFPTQVSGGVRFLTQVSGGAPHLTFALFAFDHALQTVLPEALFFVRTCTWYRLPLLSPLMVRVTFAAAAEVFHAFMPATRQRNW